MSRLRVFAVMLALHIGVGLVGISFLPRPTSAAPVSAATALALTDTLTLNPVADTTIASNAATTNFSTEAELVVAIDRLFASVDVHSLLRFDLSALPPGSIIHRAELRLRQTASDGAAWTVNVNRITENWSATSVTWSTRPPGVTVYRALALPDGADETATLEITDLARAWVYTPQATPNVGLELVGNGGASHRRAFASSESAAPPELVIDYTAPPTNIVIPESDLSISLDGQCDEGEEYARASTFPYLDARGVEGAVYLQHDADAIYVCVRGAPGRNSTRSFGLYVDTDLGRTKYADANDYGLRVMLETGDATTVVGTGEPNNVYTPTVLNRWKAAATTGNFDGVEYLIDRSLFGRTCLTGFGLALYHHDVDDQGDHYGAPTGFLWEFPDQWIEATLENPGCIRVCAESAAPCGPAPGASVRNADDGTFYAIDGDGYVINRNQIADGAHLWALLPVSATARSTLYHTSGPEQIVSQASVGGASAGVMTLVVSQQNPLLIQDLDVAAQWYVEGDAERADWLRASLIDASDFLYSFTDGQFALGRVTVQQSYDGWEAADLQLHINNIFQPRADIGGIVLTDTADLDPTLPITYAPGQMFMGSHWNRYGKPPGEVIMDGGAVVPPASLASDWAIALAHELGHYLLFLFDVYTDIDGNASKELAEQCTLSAMGDAYKPSNHAFIFDRDHWDANCSETEAYTTLGGRTEWQTIHLWYPWTITPTAFVTGPVLPAGVTSVTFVTPTNPPGDPATSQLFDLLYQDNETNSAEARGFLMRNSRVLEQGKPAKGANQIHLIDAQQGDRLCVYDINDNAEGSETPRHQFGCKTIVAGDATLDMTKDVAWAPQVDLRQTGPNQLTIAVTQAVTSPVAALIQAALYPEHGEMLMELTLSGDGNVHMGEFNLAQNVPPLYVQLFVSETVAAPATRREVILDRGTGGSGAYGPARGFGKVLVISSDGQASFESDTPIELGPGESIAWQSMPGTPPLPPNTQIRGQSYRLDAFPASLVANGSVRIRFETETQAVHAAGGDQSGPIAPRIYFWDGESWLALATDVTTPVNAPDDVRMASARSQGVGVYAVLTEVEQTIFLPMVRR